MIFFDFSTISASSPAVSFAIFDPLETVATEPSISVVVWFAASALLAARLLTSSATTANPLPAEPARAASTAAFSARIFVWKAISSITLMIFEISFDAKLISSIALSIDAISLLQDRILFVVSETISSACFALLALSVT